MEHLNNIYKQGHKIVNIRFADLCPNNCPGCPIYKNERKITDCLSKENMSIIINFLAEYFEKQTKYPHIQFGVADVLKFKDEIFHSINNFFKFDIFLENTVFEFGTTFTSDVDFEVGSQIFNEIKKKAPSSEVIFEVVIDPLVSKEKLLKVKENIEKAKKMGADIHILMRFSRSFFNLSEKILDNLIYANIGQVAVDYCFSEVSVPTNYDYSIFENWFFENFKVFLEKGVEIYPLDTVHLFNEVNSEPVDGFFIDKNLNIFFNINTPLGDIYVGNIKNENSAIANCADKNALRVVEFAEKKEFFYRKMNEDTNKVCSGCNFKNICPSGVINNYSKYKEFRFDEEKCFYGKSVANYLLDYINK